MTHDNETRDELPKRITLEQATAFFAELYYGEHHIPGPIRVWGWGWKVSHYGELATFDYDQLTRLVLLAHDRCVRAAVMQGGPRGVAIGITARSRDTARMGTDHPPIEEAIAKFRAMERRSWPDVMTTRTPKPARPTPDEEAVR